MKCYICQYNKTHNERNKDIEVKEANNSVKDIHLCDEHFDEMFKYAARAKDGYNNTDWEKGCDEYFAEIDKCLEKEEEQEDGNNQHI